MITPPYLKKGDKVAIIAPSRKISKEEISHSINILRNWGLEIVEGKHLYSSDNQFSGKDEERAKDLQEMLDDNSIKAIFTARGGYGCVRIIDRIDFSKFKTNPKWIAGFSDVTVLHSHINQNLNIETIHSEMLINFANSENQSLKYLKKILFGEKLEYNFENNYDYKNSNTESSGILTGGNLSILYSLAGTNSDISTAGKILFIEDLDEYLYHIDRMMYNLLRNGKLNNLKGLIVGSMSDMKDNTIPFGKDAYSIIADIVKKFNYPVCFGFPAGHCTENMPLILGRTIRMKLENNRWHFTYLNN